MVDGWPEPLAGDHKCSAHPTHSVIRTHISLASLEHPREDEEADQRSTVRPGLPPHFAKLPGQAAAAAATPLGPSPLRLSD